ncbi:hypothetical protein N7540_004262 [Penicillium herquei]|nr:hypothetical protein N7540_004262 [Penicillium herquei]
MYIILGWAGNYGEALAWETQAHMGWTEILGPLHPVTVASGKRIEELDRLILAFFGGEDELEDELEGELRSLRVYRTGT